MQKIIVFQQNKSGENKVRELMQRPDLFDVTVTDIDAPLPGVLDDTSDYLPETLDADLVLDYLTHPDLSHDLCRLASGLDVPVVASGKKWRMDGVFVPPTCCGLPRHADLGDYGEHFGAPELECQVDDGKVSGVNIRRQAPCGATQKAVADVLGLEPWLAVEKLGLHTQYYCTANPAGWDPIFGKSPVHFAGKVHARALEKALKQGEMVDFADKS